MNEPGLLVASVLPEKLQVRQLQERMSEHKATGECG